MSAPSAAFCKSCDYPLTGVGAAVCPECGRGFDAADPGTFAARPGVRRRRWMRRGVYVLGVIVLVELFAPSRVAKLTWSWPNADGVTATSETKWCLVAPRWLPIGYPRWTSARWTYEASSSKLTVADYTIWRAGWLSFRWELVISTSLPAVNPPNTVGCLVQDWRNNAIFTDIVPRNVDKLCDLILFHDGMDLTWCPHCPPMPEVKK